ncbi:hypothetical protein EW146_g821 [Bondarzewia mesenterica]|uniref:Endonuclease/exonuclease/phosphatase domain-containing protein n=1 Tax=Bondarzewia mesenterica TaxID=1095465 RepID=A0A4S4M5P9_9AGAM|nr:hypothetical protein EW146_g821 [Bondarzewia mesenterica]
MASAGRLSSIVRQTSLRTPVRFISTTPVVREEVVTNLGTPPIQKKPVGGIRGGIIGFLFGFSLASSFAAYRLLDEYKQASAALQASVEELQRSTEKVSAHVRRIEAVEKDLKALSEASASKDDLSRVRAEVKKIYDGLHIEFLDLRSFVWGMHFDRWAAIEVSESHERLVREFNSTSDVAVGLPLVLGGYIYATSESRDYYPPDLSWSNFQLGIGTINTEILRRYFVRSELERSRGHCWSLTPNAYIFAGTWRRDGRMVGNQQARGSWSRQYLTRTTNALLSFFPLHRPRQVLAVLLLKLQVLCPWRSSQYAVIQDRCSRPFVTLCYVKRAANQTRGPPRQALVTSGLTAFTDILGISEHSHESILTTVRTSLNLNNPDQIVDPVFALLGNAAAQQGLGKITDPDCLQLAVADQAFTNAKVAGDLDGQVNALIFRALERNSGKVGATTAACTSIQAVNPEIAAIQQHQDPASTNAAATNKAIVLELATQIVSIGGDPQLALQSGTFAPGDINDTTGKGNTCDDANDVEGCIFTQNLLVDDATADEINAAVAGVSSSSAVAVTSNAAAASASSAVSSAHALYNKLPSGDPDETCDTGRVMAFLAVVALLSISWPTVSSAISMTAIQGPAFQSSFVGQTLSNITGVVSAKGSSGFWLTGPASTDVRLSPGLSVFTTSTSIISSVAVGDSITLSARVAEFRSSSSPGNLFATELTSPTNIIILSSNNTVSAIVLGRDRSPPTQALSALDTGADGWLNVPNNVSQIDAVNATLKPAEFGLDFWESLEGVLVTVPEPTAIDFQNSFGEFWVRGAWNATGINSRGGLTITIGPDDVPDANPEAIIIGAPLDGSKNPEVAVGTKLSDITGVIEYQFGFFYLLPTTAPTIISSPDPDVPATNLTSNDSTCVLTLGDYNIENMAPTSSHLPIVAGHIANHLLLPDIVFVQEVQDNSGPTNDGVVSSNVTLTAISSAIVNASDGAVAYDFVVIDPVDGADGGQPGGNIRQAYLYKPQKMKIVPGAPAGGSLNATEAKRGSHGKVKLTYVDSYLYFPALRRRASCIQLQSRPHRPYNSCWDDSRKPLAVLWETPTGHRFFTINHHGTSKGGSSSTGGDARPPVNFNVEKRTTQVEVISTFIQSILDLDPFASILLAGDFNEYSQTRSAFTSLASVMLEADELANVPPVERYTYVFDQNSEALDHVFVTKAVARRGVEIEHVHVNNWSPSLDVRASDHDPSVAKVKVC